MVYRVYRVVVRGIKGDRFTLDLCKTQEQFQRLTVKDLKIKILERLPSYVEYGDRLTYIFADERLEDESRLLSDYGVQHMSVIQMVLQVDGGGGPDPNANMGDRDHKNRSMDRLADFQTKDESCLLL